jgi:mono/diheme cytochrome c family protein
MSLVRISTGPVAAAVALLLVAALGRAEQKATASSGKSIYDRECATCHGPEGKGDGETAAYLTPQPQDFTNAVIQKRSDEFLTAVIAKGGPAKGLSESMPGFPKLSKADVQSVVAYVRQLSKGGAAKPAK